MDRIQFLHSIQYVEGTGVLDILLSFFDQYMLLYNMVENVNGVSIIEANENIITFKVEYIDQESLHRVFDNINNNRTVFIYESVYKITPTIVSNTEINITISK